VLLLLCGAAWQFGAKLVLGRSFGLLPAQRGLVTSGPYRVMRHPIYCGYLISHIGFLLVNASWWNFAVLSVLCAAQLLRIRREEALLADSRDAQYNRYRCQVRWRVLPFVY
jgi:protein-S-isoprenylcysteine O-methyltransferase Ste14